ncbi:hypothetical protein ACFC01_28475 [Streptomyces mirabilis]|uniref:hypothetical protein n=1 Tax=Streptomyces mirabilis TaxID=68239 RepID=UPI0035E2D8E7
MVGQDGQRAAPGGLAERGELARPDGLLRPVGVHVRVLEQAECEFLAQESTYGFIDAFLRDTARADQFHDHLGALLAAELVAARVQRLRRAFGDGQVLGAPGPRGERLAEHGRVGEQAPVGADDAVEAVSLLPSFLASFLPCSRRLLDGLLTS